MVHAVNDTVYISAGRYGRTLVFPGIITKITPTGIITVQPDMRSIPMRFNKFGTEINGDPMHRARLIERAEYDRLNAAMNVENYIRHVHMTIKEASVIPVNADHKTQLIEALRKALAAVEAI